MGTSNVCFPSFEDLRFQVPYKQEAINAIDRQLKYLPYLIKAPCCKPQTYKYLSGKLEITDIEFNSWHKSLLFRSKYLPRQAQVFLKLAKFSWLGRN